MAVKAEMKMEVRQTKIILQLIAPEEQADKKLNLVPQIQEVLLELRMKLKKSSGLLDA